MPAWLWIVLGWFSAALLVALGLSRWFRWVRGDFDRHYDDE